MTTWKRGRDAPRRAMLRGAGLPLDLFLADIERRKPPPRARAPPSS